MDENNDEFVRGRREGELANTFGRELFPFNPILGGDEVSSSVVIAGALRDSTPESVGIN